MTRVLFGQSYFLRFDPKLWQAQQPYPPLGTLYAAAFLRQAGYEVALFDAMLASSEDQWGQALEQHAPDVAVLYEDNFNYLSKMCLLRMRQAAFRMVDLARQRGIPVIVSGADATDHTGEYLGRGANFVLLGEGEATLRELLDHLGGQTSTPLEAIPGLAFASGQAVQRGPPRPDWRSLDDLPFPARDLVDMDRYRTVWLERHGRFSMNLVTTRGCPFHCNWCAKPIWGQRYHSRSPENVAAELRLLKEHYQPDHIWFADDILGLKPGWLARFAAQVADVKTPFKCLSRADLLLRPGEVEALAQAGAEIVWVGAESGSQQVLDAMEKGTRVEQILEARRRLKSAGIQAGFFLQFGYPGESWEDIQQTLQMVRRAGPDDIGVSVSYPLPGTPFYEAVRQQLGAKQNWQDSSDLAMLYSGPFSTAFYRQLHRVVHTEFRARRAWQALRAPAQGGPTVRARLQAALRLVYHGLALPLARLQLVLRARSSRAGFVPRPILTPEAAARPTPQEEA